MIETIIDRARQHLSKESLTSLVTDESLTRRFIPEPLIIGAVIYILHVYCDAFLKATIGHMGDRQGERVRQWAQDFIDKLRSGTATEADLADAKERVESEVQQIKASPKSDAAQQAAEAAVETELYSAGAVHEQARNEAQELSQIIQRP